MLLKRLYVLVFVEHGTRRMHLGGVTPSTAASALLGTLTAPLSGGGIFLVLLALAGAVLQRQAQRPKPDWADQALLARPPGTSPSAQ